MSHPSTVGVTADGRQAVCLISVRSWRARYDCVRLRCRAPFRVFRIQCFLRAAERGRD
jgi:hypothetical protein